MGMLSRVVAVLGLLLAGTVVVVATGTPAGAAVVPCTKDFWLGGSNNQVGPGQVRQFGTVVDPFEWPSPTFEVPVTDVDVAFTLDVPWGQEPRIDVRMLHEGFGVSMVREHVLGEGGFYSITFDDAAATWWQNSGATSGTFRPVDPLGSFNHQPARGTWALEVRNSSGGFFTVRDARVRITTSGCDSDGDGVAQTVDNCPFVVNPDQRDWDGDGTGNACDSTPGTDPNAPLPPTSPAVPTVPAIPSAPITTSVPGCSASCVYERTVELRHLARKSRLVGSVASVASGCQSGVPVTIWRQRSGADRQLVVLTSRYSGSFRTKAPRKPGRYYATVGSAGEPLCGAGQSPTVRVRRR